MEEKGGRGKVYEFKPRKSPRLKTVKYISPEKKQLLREREQVKKDKKHFYFGAGILLAVVAVLTLLRLR